MNLLTLDIQEYIPDIIEAYTEVFGEEYRNIIEKNLNNILYVLYNTEDNMYAYLKNLKKFKQKELGIKFLDSIGIDVEEEKKKSYTEGLNENTLNLLENYLGYSYFDNSSDGIKAFISNNEESFYQIEFLNFIRKNQNSIIDENNLEEFCKTSEYKAIQNKIDKYLKIYRQLEKEYQDYLHELSPYQEYVDTEKERRKQLEDSAINELYEHVVKEGLISDEITSYLDKSYSNTSDKIKQIFNVGLHVESNLEYFSKKYEDIINDDSYDDLKKSFIYLNRINYFKSIGVVKKDLEFDFWGSKKNYEDIISQDNIKGYIPPFELVQKITKLRETVSEKSRRDFICENLYYVKYAKECNNEHSKEMLYNIIKNSRTCIVRW